MSDIKAHIDLTKRLEKMAGIKLQEEPIPVAWVQKYIGALDRACNSLPVGDGLRSLLTHRLEAVADLLNAWMQDESRQQVADMGSRTNEEGAKRGG